MTRLALIVLLPAAGCSDVSSNRPSTGSELFDRVAFLMNEYNIGVANQETLRIEAAGSDLKRLAVERLNDLVQDLALPEGKHRTYAAFALGFSRKKEAIAPLAAAADDEDPAVRANAIAALGTLATDGVPMEAFRKRLDDPEPEVRTAALFGLRPLVSENSDRGMIEAIHAKLSDPAMDVRNEALILLRKLRRKESVEKILERSIKDGESLVRANAAATLGAIGKDAVHATPALIEMLRDDMHQVVEAVWIALNQINGKDLDRSYSTWRDWYEDEQKFCYVCLEHKEVSASMPGVCPECKVRLDRVPKPTTKSAAGATYSCPAHPEVLTKNPGKCGKCDRDLVPKK